VQRAEKELAAQLGHPPTVEQIARHAELEPGEVQALHDIARTVTSLDRRVGEEGEAAFGDLLAGEGPQPEEAVHVSLREEAVRRALGELPEDERRVVELRYGMDGEDRPLGLQETGRRLNLRPSQVRRLERRALERLSEIREIEALHEAA
jgi:RNA polymerase primary sigma factor